VRSLVRGELQLFWRKQGVNMSKLWPEAEAAFSIDDTKDPSAEASLIGGKIFTDIWENGGRAMAHEIMK
jgi:hypothetical protein